MALLLFRLLDQAAAAHGWWSSQQFVVGVNRGLASSVGHPTGCAAGGVNVGRSPAGAAGRADLVDVHGERNVR